MIMIGEDANYWSNLKAKLSEEEIIASSKPKLRNSCIVFADD